MLLNDSVRRLLQDPLIAYMSVLDSKGFPHTVPVWFGVDGDDLTIITDPGSRKVKYIHANSKGSMVVGGIPYGAEGYLLKGYFSVEPDPNYRWTREITYRYEPKERADELLAEWTKGDITVLRFKISRVIKI